MAIGYCTLCHPSTTLLPITSDGFTNNFFRFGFIDSIKNRLRNPSEKEGMMFRRDSKFLLFCHWISWVY
jgi:hypothetical protein